MTNFRQLARNLTFVVGVLLWLPQLSWAQVASPPIDFARQIQPILESHCYRCHGATQRSGGVRFDQWEDVISGGYSQSPLIGGTLEMNEIYRRITSSDAAYRMPKGAPPLAAAEIALIRRWVEAGSPWPQDAAAQAATFAGNWFNLEAWLKFAERWVNEVPGFTPWLCVMLALQVGLLSIERYKQAVRAERAWTGHPRVRWLVPLRFFNMWHFVVIDLLMAVWLLLEVQAGLQAKNRELETSLTELRQPTSTNDLPTAFTVYGNPPIPLHPGHAPRLSGTYYRGNCERHENLFNGGNYRTANLRISLIDRQRREIQYGDPVAADSLAIRFELERAPGTTDALFGDAITKGVFLTKQALTEKLTAVTEPIEHVQVVKPGWKWEAIVPLEGPHDNLVTTMSGMIYVYQGALEKKQARGTLHYGIKYDLHLNQLTLEPRSEVWMGNLFWTPNLEHPHQGKLPLAEWFDDEPIPEISGENSTDPKLLGIP